MENVDEDCPEAWYQAMEGQGNNSRILYDNDDDGAHLPNIPVSSHLDYLGCSAQDPHEPFIFYKVNELCQLSPNKLPKRKQVKTCGVYKMTKQRTYLVEPLQCEKEEFKLDVDFELVGDLPPVGRMIEVFGYMTSDEVTKKLVFNAWFWRERTGSYNMMVELYLKHRKEYDDSPLKT